MREVTVLLLFFVILAEVCSLVFSENELPDLVVNDVKWYPSFLSPGDRLSEVKFVITVVNEGDSPSGSFTITLEIKSRMRNKRKRVTLITSWSTRVRNLDPWDELQVKLPRGSISSNFKIPLDANVLKFIIKVDVNNEVKERNERNNVERVEIPIVNVSRIVLSVRYINGAPVKKARIYFEDELVGFTDSYGNAMITLPMDGGELKVIKRIKGLSWYRGVKYVDPTEVRSVKIVLLPKRCLRIINAKAIPAKVRRGEEVTIRVKVMFYICCPANCTIKANAFGDWSKNKQLAVIHDGPEDAFHEEIIKEFKIRIPKNLKPGLHHVRVGFSYSEFFPINWYELGKVIHKDVPINVKP